MFLTLLAVTFLVALAVSFVVARIFDASVRRILRRLVSDELSDAWHRYIIFALYVVGVSRGVRLYALEQYVLPRPDNQPPFLLTPERWTLEVYRTVIETLQGVAWMLLVFFLVALVAFVIVRAVELYAHRRDAARDRA
ncbi:MAG TPA: hypothetical protein VFS08_18605 [Gemmatimonadaceae bacterium]|nr:hypothetical protein [Gemmatimonadaceae bacterium]